MNLPPDVSTELFATDRTLRWLAHWAELLSAPEQKIDRPRHKHTGPAGRPCSAITTAGTHS